MVDCCCSPTTCPLQCMLAFPAAWKVVNPQKGKACWHQTCVPAFSPPPGCGLGRDRRWAPVQQVHAVVLPLPQGGPRQPPGVAGAVGSCPQLCVMPSASQPAGGVSGHCQLCNHQEWQVRRAHCLSCAAWLHPGLAAWLGWRGCRLKAAARWLVPHAAPLGHASELLANVTCDVYSYRCASPL